MAVPTYTATGNKATTAAKLDKAVFGLDVDNHELLKQAYLTYRTNARVNLAVTQTRGLVRGGGRKPWRQKGTGRARFGSSRTPIWRGGGIIFGPTGNENYTKSLNVKSKRQAIRQALSIATTDNKISVIENLSSIKGKTAELNKLLNKLEADRKVLLVTHEKTPEILRAVSNLPGVTLISSRYLSVYEILNADQIILTTQALEEVTAWLKQARK